MLAKRRCACCAQHDEARKFSLRPIPANKEGAWANTRKGCNMSGIDLHAADQTPGPVMNLIRPGLHILMLQPLVLEQVKALEVARYAKEQEEAHIEAMEEKARRQAAHQQ